MSLEALITSTRVESFTASQGGTWLSKSRFIHVLILGQTNILVDAQGRARIMGFRFAKVTPSEDPGQAVSIQHIRSKQWSAPEVLEDGEMSKKADIFSFAMVMIEARHAWSIICRVWAHARFPST